MAGRRKGGARRRTCVVSAICQSKPHSSELARRNALAGLRQRRQASSSAKRWITFARASTAHDRRNRRSPSGCRRRAKRASIFPRRKRGRHPNALVAQRNEPCARGAAAARRRLQSRSRATRDALKREGHAAASKTRARATGTQQRAQAFGVGSTCIGQAGGEDEGTRPSPFGRQACRRHASTPVGSLTRPAGNARVRVRHRTCFKVSRAWEQARVLRGDRLFGEGRADGLEAYPPVPPALITGRGRVGVD